MFARTIIDSDSFLDMPLSSQALYFHLSMRADDEGFINNPRKIARMIGSSDDDMKVLVSKHFIIPFESGIVVIKHWRIHNYIRGDRLKETVYKEERAQLSVKENNAYTLCEQVTDKCQSDVSQVTDKCPHRLGKGRVGKDSLVEGSISSAEDEEFSTEFSTDNIETTPATATEEENNFSEYDDNELHAIGGRGLGVVYLTERQEEMLLDKMDIDGYNYYLSKLARFIVDKNATVKNHYETINKWYDEDRKI